MAQQSNSSLNASRALLARQALLAERLRVQAKLTQLNEEIQQQEQPGVSQEHFPGVPTGDVRGSNGLERTNWFNGRYLTGEALRRQDSYFDARLRMNAMAMTPGIVWGLGMRCEQNNKITLSPGLAFDHIGNPILVEGDFHFNIESLLKTYKTNPRTAVISNTEFAPCNCIPTERDHSNAGPSARPGPYLLVIEAGETSEGHAKVMGDICGGSQPKECQAEFLRAGFGLSLVRFDAPLPTRLTSNAYNQKFALRGVLASYYFDEYEHSIYTRWNAQFLNDGGFREGTGSSRSPGAVIPLAMLYLNDGNLVFLDQWIPRRIVCSTPGEEWHRSQFGSPPRSAAWARLHQFQAMLAEQLEQDGNKKKIQDLHRFGFRHIPSIGFLPLKLQGENLLQKTAYDNYLRWIGSMFKVARQGASIQRWLNKNVGTYNTGEVLYAYSLYCTSFPFIAEALRQGKKYFQNTNVIPYGVVALHDDDIFEDLTNVIDKDPIQLEDVAAMGKAMIEWAKPGPEQDTGPKYGLLIGILMVLLLEADSYVNRRIEIVKIIVPLQGLSRNHPLTNDKKSADSTQLRSDWGVQPWQTSLGQIVNAPLTATKRWLGLDMLPRHFVVYVKQRLVLLDLLFFLLETISTALSLTLAAFFITEAARSGSMHTTAPPRMEGTHFRTTTQIQESVEQLDPGQLDLTRGALSNLFIQNVFVSLIRRTGSDLTSPPRVRRFKDKVTNRAKELQQPPARMSAADAQQRALNEMADLSAAESSDFGLIQFITAALPPEQVLSFVDQLVEPSTTSREITVVDTIMEADIQIPSNDDVMVVYAETLAGIRELPVSEVVPNLESDLVIRDILDMPVAKAKQILGVNAYDSVISTLTTNRKLAAQQANVLADGLKAILIDQLESSLPSESQIETAVQNIRAQDRSHVSVGDVRKVESVASLLKMSGRRPEVLRRIKRT